MKSGAALACPDRDSAFISVENAVVHARQGVGSESQFGSRVVLHLKRHESDVRGLDPNSIEPAERLLSYLADTKADVLVIGAPGQLSGRAAAKRSLTRHVLEHMTIPVLLSY